LEDRKAIMARRNKLERKLDEYNHTMELIRTVVPIAVLILQIVILVKVI
jgi:heme/copper-type cytochrome/quinol oxidase subunit 2